MPPLAELAVEANLWCEREGELVEEVGKLTSEKLRETRIAPTDLRRKH